MALASRRLFPTTRITQSRAIVMQATAREVISTDKAPAALGPYSQAIKAGNTVYVSGQVSAWPHGILLRQISLKSLALDGQIGLVPGTKDFAGPEVEAQTEQVLKNMGAILEAAGASYQSVVK